MLPWLSELWLDLSDLFCDTSAHKYLEEEVWFVGDILRDFEGVWLV